MQNFASNPIADSPIIKNPKALRTLQRHDWPLPNGRGDELSLMTWRAAPKVPAGHKAKA